jgi:hypothetical protein
MLPSTVAMDEPWPEIDRMVSELGEIYAIEFEAAAFPELTDDPAVRKIHIEVLRATDEMQRVARAPREVRLDRARDALAVARETAAAARLAIIHARAARNRDH